MASHSRDIFQVSQNWKVGRHECQPCSLKTVPLESESQGELHDSWKIICAGNLPKTRATTTIRIRRIELYTIEQVEELCAELKAKPFVRTEFRVLEGCKVKIFHSVIPYVWLSPRIITVVVHVRITGREYGRIKPMGQPLVQRAGGQMRQGSPDRPGAATIGNTRAAECTRAPADNDGKPALEGDDGINSPSTDEFIRNAVHAAQEFFASPNRQVEYRANYEPLWNIERIQAALVTEVVRITVVPAHG